MINRLEDLKNKWGKDYPYAFKSWEVNWDVSSLSPKGFIQKIIYIPIFTGYSSYLFFHFIYT